MKKWYAIRDAFFWWVGVWATVTLANHGVTRFLRRRRLKHEIRLFSEFHSAHFDEEPESNPDTESEKGA